MSKENRKKEYDKLVKLGKLSQDDGSLIKEFGQASHTTKKLESEKEIEKVISPSSQSQGNKKVKGAKK